MMADADDEVRARDEAVRQLVLMVFSVATAVVIAYVQRRQHDPAAAAGDRMRVFKGAERRLAAAAGWFWRQAERARQAYERESA